MVAIVLYTYPAFVVVLAVLAIGERVGRRTLLALALSLGGVALAIGANPAGASVIGILIVLGAAIAYAAYITLSRRMLDITHPLVLTAHVLPRASVTFLTIGLATGSLTVPSASPAWGILVGPGRWRRPFRCSRSSRDSNESAPAVVASSAPLNRR